MYVCVCVGGQDSGSTAWDSDVTKPITLRRGSGAVTVYVDESTTPHSVDPAPCSVGPCSVGPCAVCVFLQCASVIDTLSFEHIVKNLKR